MRIIAGEFRSRKLLPPPEESSTRPIPDRVKESLFSILRGQVEGAEVFDGFAGTGAIGLEALSRGAARCVFVERDRAMAAVLEKNIRGLGVGDRAEVVVGDALGAGALARCPRPGTVLVLDPPYDLMRGRLGSRRVKDQLAALVQHLADDGFAVLRTPWPLFYADDEPEPAATPGPARARRASRGGRAGTGRHAGQGRPDSKGRWDEVWTIERGASEDLRDILKDAGEVEPAADGQGVETPRAPRRPIELKVQGASGPETHVYGTMALHFYMRPR